MEIFDFLFNVPYLEIVLGLLVAAHALAIAIVNLTTTPKDDAIVTWVYKYIELVAGIFNSRKVKS